MRLCKLQLCMNCMGTLYDIVFNADGAIFLMFMYSASDKIRVVAIIFNIHDLYYVLVSVINDGK